MQLGLDAATVRDLRAFEAAARRLEVDLFLLEPELRLPLLFARVLHVVMGGRDDRNCV